MVTPSGGMERRPQPHQLCPSLFPNLKTGLPTRPAAARPPHRRGPALTPASSPAPPLLHPSSSRNGLSSSTLPISPLQQPVPSVPCRSTDTATSTAFHARSSVLHGNTRGTTAEISSSLFSSLDLAAWL
eukprot:tig00021434_g21344.t1